jgi:branched-chain amino acid transport system permease protein
MSTAWSLSTCCGFSFGHSAYYGCGAYATLILLSTYGVNPLIGALAGVAVAVILAATTGGLIFRLKSHYFALGSIAIGEIVRNVVNNIPSVTNGAEGINAPALQPLVIAGKTITDFTGKAPFFYLALTLAIIVLTVSYVLQNSKMGYYFRAIQEDQDAACSLGISLTRYKTLALCLSAGLMSLSGSLYAVYIRFIEPGTVMSLDISIESILMSILGGVAIFGGSAIGALILIPLSEVLRSNLIGETLVKIGMVTEGGTAEKVFSNLAHAHVLIYGILVVLIILYAPQGVLGFVKDKFKGVTK